MVNKSRVLALGLGGAVLVLADQALKQFVRDLVGGESVPDFITWHLNHGISFGIDLPFWLSVTLMIVFLLVLLWLYLRPVGQPAIYYWGLGLAIGGGASNLIDRLWLGAVRDFVDVGWLPIFNLADVLVFVGVVCVVIGATVSSRHRPR